MDDAVRVEVVEGVDELLRDLADFGLGQVAVIFQNFEELTLGELQGSESRRAYLSDNTELVRSFKAIQKQDNVLVVEAFQNFDFLAQIVQFLLLFVAKNG